MNRIRCDYREGVTFGLAASRNDRSVAADDWRPADEDTSLVADVGRLEILGAHFVMGRWYASLHRYQVVFRSPNPILCIGIGTPAAIFPNAANLNRSCT